MGIGTVSLICTLKYLFIHHIVIAGLENHVFARTFQFDSIRRMMSDELSQLLIIRETHLVAELIRNWSKQKNRRKKIDKKYLTVEKTIYKDNYKTKKFNDKNIYKKGEYL